MKTLFVAPIVALLAGLAEACQAGGARAADAGAHDVAFEDLFNVTWALEPEVSPDGSRVFYSLLEAADGRRRTTHWIALASRGGAPVRVLAAFEATNRVRWSPDGERMAFLAAGGSSAPGPQVYVAGTDGSDPRSLTRMPHGVVDYRWAPDSAAIAFTADEREHGSGPGRVEGADPARNALWTIALDDAEPRRITPDDRCVFDFAWSPDGERFAATVAPLDEIADPSPRFRLAILRRDDGSIERVLAEDAAPGNEIAWSPDGAHIEAQVFGPRRISRRLALFGPDGAEPRFPLEGLRATPIGRIEWTADSRYLLVRCIEATRNRLVRLEPSTGAIERLGAELTNFWDYGADRDGTTLAFNAESQHMPPNVVVLRGERAEALTDVNPDLAGRALGDVRTLQWQSTLDGRTVYGVLLTPPEGDPPYPTVVNLHSGPHWMWWEGWLATYLTWGQYLATSGYAVFMPNHRGSIGQGCEFAEAHYREWGRGDYQDVIDGVDMLVEQGIADPNRLAVGGGSFGGYLAAWAVTQTDRFRACVVESGWADLVSFNLTTDAPGGLCRYMGGDELELGELYESRSPLALVRRCSTPTLLLHGENDRRAPADQARALHRALGLCGVESKLVIYANEGHVFERRENQLDSLLRVRAWLDRFLMPD